MKKYRIGIVGCGNMGQWYARRFAEVGGELVACSDPDRERAGTLAEPTGASVYTDHREMVNSEDLDIVAVCTWPTYHHRVTLDAAAAGVKGIICEKPLAVTLDEADEMIAACKANNVTLVTGHQHRFAPWTRTARDVIASGKLGDIELIWGHCSLDLMNNGSHVIDTIHALNGDEPADWIFGQIDTSSRIFGQRNHPDMHAENAAVGRVRYKNGVTALIDMGERANQSFGFKVIGSDGVLELEGRQVRYLCGGRTGWVSPAIDEGLGGREKIDDLLAALEKKSEPVSSGRRGRAALEVIVGIFASVQRRGVVETPVDAGDLSLKKLLEADRS